MRDFQARSGFLSQPNALQFVGLRMGLSFGVNLFPSKWLFMPQHAIGRAGFRAYMQQTHAMM
jgi:hypothetical protein